MTGFVIELIELNFVCVRRAGGGGTGGWGGNGRSSTAAHLVESQKVSLLLSHSAGSTIHFSFILNKISANGCLCHLKRPFKSYCRHFLRLRYPSNCENFIVSKKMI